MGGVVGVEDGDAAGDALFHGRLAIPLEDAARVGVAVEDGGDAVALDRVVVGDHVGVVPFVRRRLLRQRGRAVAGDIDVVGEDDGAPAVADLLREIGDEKREAVERGETPRTLHAIRAADDDPEIHEVNARPVPRVMQPVVRDLREPGAARVALADVPEHEPFSVRAVVIPMHLAHRPRQRAVAAIEPVIRDPRGKFRLLHGGIWPVVFVAAVDDVARVDEPVRHRDPAPTRGLRHLGARQFLQPPDEPLGVSARDGIELAGVILVRKIMRIPDEEKRRRILCARLRRSVIGPQRTDCECAREGEEVATGDGLQV